MGRPAKDFYNWTRVDVPYTPGDWQGTHAAEKFLQNHLDEREFEIRVTTDYPKPRTRYSMKKVTSHVYFIKDKQMATMFALKFS
jgi:hypothetical protein